MVKCFLHVLRKYKYDLLNVFRRKWQNLLYTDFKDNIFGDYQIHHLVEY